MLTRARLHRRARSAVIFMPTAMALATTAALPAHAQTDDSATLEQIVVTAQRRDENMQSVPLAVSAITADAALAQGVTSSIDLSVTTPGLVISNSGQGTAIYLRGVGTQNTVVGDESSNPVYVDGVYYATINSSLFSFNNVERIEILKGPQGTLFGRNATGGLIQVVTRTPTREPTLEVGLGYGNYDTVEGRLYASAPVLENSALDLAVYYKDQQDGWGVNLATGEDVYTHEDIAMRSKLLLSPSERTDFTFSIDWAESTNSSSGAFAVLPGSLGLAGFPPPDDFYDVNEAQPELFSQSGGVSLKARHELSWAQLVNITAYRKIKVENAADQDRIPLVVADTFATHETDTFTQELQLMSLPDSDISWIVGVYYLNSTADLSPLELRGASMAAAGGVLERYAKQDTESIAAFAQATFPLTDRTNLTAGFRYTADERKLHAHDVTATGAMIGVLDSKSDWSEPTWRLALDHKFTDDFMLYGSYSRGFKSGVYNLFAPTVDPVNPESLDAYEIGQKAEFFDNRLRVNTSLFYYEYKDIQLIQAFAGGSRLLNAAEATVRGVDLEMLAMPIRGLTLSANLQFLDGEYDRFPDAPAAQPNPAVCTPTPTTIGPVTGGNTNCVIDASGFQMIRSPDYTYTLAATYEWDVGFGTLTGSANYYRTDDYPFEPSNRLRQPAYDLINAQLAWASLDGRYRVRLWGRNLTRREYYLSLASSVGDTGQAAAPRTYGIAFEYRM